MPEKPGFICTGKCDQCPVHDWRSLIVPIGGRTPVFRIQACSKVLSYSFNVSIISEKDYNEYLKTKEYLCNEDDEKFICPQRSHDPKREVCSTCNVYSYLNSIGCKPLQTVQHGYRRFHDLDGNNVTCKDCMYKLCGVNVVHEAIDQKLTAYKKYDVDEEFIDKITTDIIARVDYLREVHEKNKDLYERSIKEEEERKIAKQKKREAEAVKAAERAAAAAEKRRRQALEEKEKLAKRKANYAKRVEDLKQYARANGLCDLSKIDHYDFSDPKIDQFLRPKYNLLPYPSKKKTPYDKYREHFVKQKQKAFVEYTSKLLYDVEKDKYYHTILQAPVCCGDCHECEIAKIYDEYHYKMYSSGYRTDCYDYAPKHLDEINQLFRFFRVSEIINLPYNGGLIFCNSDQDIIHAIKMYLGKKFIDDPESAAQYINYDF